MLSRLQLSVCEEKFLVLRNERGTSAFPQTESPKKWSLQCQIVAVDAVSATTKGKNRAVDRDSVTRTGTVEGARDKVKDGGG